MPTSRSSSGRGGQSSSTQGTTSTRSASVKSTHVSHRHLAINADHAPSRPRNAADDTSTSFDEGIEIETPTSMPPKQLFVVGTIPDPTIGDEVTVSTLVRQRIFSHVKFLCNPVDELAFTNDARSICGIVRSYCNPPANVPDTEWWQNARKWVGRQIAIQRNSRNTKLKWTFMGTWCSVLLSLFIFETNLLFVQFG
jgi:hypothetical protein